jgi:hypothetical protein
MDTRFKKGEMPKAGKQFSSDYQPDKEIWTEEVSLLLFNDLLDWMTESNLNFLYEEFLFDNPKLRDYGGKIYPELISYLKDKFPSCFKLYKKAEKIQEIRLTKYALHDKVNAGFAKFILSATHGLKEKTEVEKNVNLQTNIDPFALMRENHAINSETKEGT